MEKIIISCLESRVETSRSIYARFLLGPFKDDQAVTIATALRRSLLSKVKSIAITAIHIQGVTHEFSTIVGVRESVLDLALNFQQVVLRDAQLRCAKQTNKQTKMFNAHKSTSKAEVIPAREQSFNFKVRNKRSLVKGELRPEVRATSAKQKLNNKSVSSGNYSDEVTPLSENVQIGYLQVQGPAIIYANDLKLPIGVECVDPTQYIATLSTEGLLVVKFVIGEKKASFNNNKEKVIGSLSPNRQNGYHNIAPTHLLPKRRLDLTSFQAQSGSLANTFRSSPYKNEIFAQNTFRSQNYTPSTQISPPAIPFDSTIGLRNTIFLDPLFDSVFQVNYIIEKDDLFNQPRERIILELWTNGSVHPRQALHKASLSLISTFSIFRNVFQLDSV